MKIAIVTPCYSGVVNLNFCLSLMETVNRVKKSECMFYSVAGSSILPMARNALVAKAMAWGADKIVMIDDDISWKSDDFQRLVLHPVSICAGVYQKRPFTLGERAEFAVSTFPEGFTPDWRGLCEVDGAATGFLRVDREVFEALKPTVCKLYDPKEQTGPVADEMFEYFAYGKMIKDDRTAFEGEDFNFCRKARAIGHRTFIDPAIKLGHYSGQLCFGASLPPMEIF
jgi:hypothetical protein